MTFNIALDLVKALAGLIVQLHQRDAAARVGGAQHIGSSQIRFCHNKHGLHILVDGSGGQLVQHQRTGYGLGRAGNDEQNIQIGNRRTNKDVFAR